jgi:NTP pyrophosphatase (non-canonical NTP hydrolase)
MNEANSSKNDLSIPSISATNYMRCRRWHKGGIDSWSLSDWATALAGEVGELCNIIKKLNRVRDGLVGNKETPEELQAALGKEIADVYLYLDLVARRANVDLEDAIVSKFNEVSERNGFPERLQRGTPVRLQHDDRCELMQPHGHEPPKCTCRLARENERLAKLPLKATAPVENETL